MTDERFPTSGLLVSKNGGIASGKDLNGKTIGVATLRSLDQLAACILVDKQGGDSKTLQFVELIAPSALEALLQGRVAAITLEPPQTSDRSGQYARTQPRRSRERDRAALGDDELVRGIQLLERASGYRTALRRRDLRSPANGPWRTVPLRPRYYPRFSTRPRRKPTIATRRNRIRRYFSPYSRWRLAMALLRRRTRPISYGTPSLA